MINFEYLNDTVNNYKNKLNNIKNKLEEKENLENTLSKLEEENISIKKDLEKQEIEKRNNEKRLSEEIDNFKDEINLLDKKNNTIKLNEALRNKIFELINDYSVKNYIEAKDIYQKEIKCYETNTVIEKNDIENKIKNENDKLKVLNEELRILNETNELEYEEDEITKESEILLNERNIPFIQLYKVIEFKNNINETDRNKLEELLISMNILNAKLVPNKYLDKIKDIKSVFLKKGTYKQKNILEYFDIIENDIISKEEIKDILSSVSIDDNDNQHITINNYELDFIIGYPSLKYESKYIGIIKRQEEHRNKIVSKEKEIEEKNKIINNYQNMISNINTKLENIKNMFSLFPNNQLLEEINNQIIKITNSIDIYFERSKQVTEEANKINNEIKIKIEEINNLKESIQIPLNLNSYKNALSLIEVLEDDIKSLKDYSKTKQDNLKYKNDREIWLEEISDEISDSNIEFNEKNKKKDELSSKKKAIEDILSNPDYKKQIDELNHMYEREKQIPNENNSLREEKGKLENQLETLNESLIIEKENLSKENIKLELLNIILEREYNLKYVYNEEELNVNKILNDLKNRENSDKNKAFENYIMALNNYKQNLLDYHLTTKEIFTNNDELLIQYEEKGLSKEEISEILNSMNRQDLETTYQGKKLNIYELTSCLKEAVKESENYITVQERHFFEDILLKTVGNKIRNRIESSQEWVKKINKIMKETQIDSNLSFELEWRSKTAFTEEELDTKELIRLFKIDAGQLLDEDKDKLFTHFHSQINQELENNDKNGDSYSNVIFKVLDYRNWFEFKLFYKRKSGERKELTNKVFSILSGGERAKSMYVPLFASVYAKLLNARASSLRLIALDEAFAGVDNSNIREMFDILSQLNLDYILTSQSLWGDYDTVKELSICELIKDEIHKAVAVRHYKWNGHSKEILEKSDLYE